MAQMSQSRGVSISHVTLGDSSGGSGTKGGPNSAGFTLQNQPLPQEQPPSHTGAELSLMSLSPGAIQGR